MPSLLPGATTRIFLSVTSGPLGLATANWPQNSYVCGTPRERGDAAAEEAAVTAASSEESVLRAKKIKIQVCYCRKKIH